MSNQEVSKDNVIDTKNPSWRSELKKQISGKDRTSLGRVKMSELPPDVRNKNYEEVNRGLTLTEAMQEAKRCLDCPNPGCVQGCPVGIDIPSFIKRIEVGQILDAAKVLKETSALPAVCGRVCPQEKQCEALCIHKKMKKEPVAIGYLERFAADFERESGQISVPEVKQRNGIKIAVAGSGPAGLSFAGDMAKYGYDVTVFEALHEIGGVLKYGIPEFRLPNAVIDVEIDTLRKTGVKFVTNCIVGKTISIEDLKRDGFRAIFVASGAGLPNFMHIKGENYNGVMSSNEYLTRINLMGAARDKSSDTPVLSGKTVAVIGGGNTAMDSVRTALRVGYDSVSPLGRGDARPPRRDKTRQRRGCRVSYVAQPDRVYCRREGTCKTDDTSANGAWRARCGRQTQTCTYRRSDCYDRRRYSSGCYRSITQSAYTQFGRGIADEQMAYGGSRRKYDAIVYTDNFCRRRHSTRRSDRHTRYGRR